MDGKHAGVGQFKVGEIHLKSLQIDSLVLCNDNLPNVSLVCVRGLAVRRVYQISRAPLINNLPRLFPYLSPYNLGAVCLRNVWD